jgi:hypothetical protein
MHKRRYLGPIYKNGSSFEHHVKDLGTTANEWLLGANLSSAPKRFSLLVRRSLRLAKCLADSAEQDNPVLDRVVHSLSK